MKKIKYGLIGTGNMMRGTSDALIAGGHLACIAAIDDIEIAAAADPNHKNLEIFRKKNNNKETHCFHDYRDLLKCEQVDAVVIATPDHTHVDIAIDSLNSGKHVLCEKPAATNREDISRLEKSVSASKKVYQVGLECRYLPLYQRMREIIGSDIGNPRMMWCKEFRGPFKEKTDNWILFNRSTGGLFVEKMCHFFDLLTWFSGSNPKKVVSLAGQDVVKEIYGASPDVFDNGWTLVEYENGIRCSVGVCMFCECGYDIEIGVIGDAGMLEGFFKKHTINSTNYHDRKTVHIDVKPEESINKLSHGGGVYFEHLAFIRNIRNNLVPLTGITAAKWSTLVGLAAEESARKGGEPVTF